MKYGSLFKRMGFGFSGISLGLLISGAAIAAVFHVNMGGVTGSDLYNYEGVPLTSAIGSEFTFTTRNDPDHPADIPEPKPSFRNYGNIESREPLIRDDGMLEFYWSSYYRETVDDLTDDRNQEYRASASSNLRIKLDWAALRGLATQPEGSSGLVPIDVGHFWYEADFRGYESWDDDGFWSSDGSVATVTVLEADVPSVPLPAGGVLGMTGLLAFVALRLRRKRNHSAGQSL